MLLAISEYFFECATCYYSIDCFLCYFSTTYLVNTNVDPPNIADKEAKNDPSSRVLRIVLSLFITDFLISCYEDMSLKLT